MSGIEKKKSGSCKHKRYRDKCKADREGLQSQVSVLQRRVASLQIAHDSLSARNNTLQRLDQIADSITLLEADADLLNDEPAVHDGYPCKMSRHFGALCVDYLRISSGHKDCLLSAEDLLDPFQYHTYREAQCRLLFDLCGQSLQPSPSEKLKAEECVKESRAARRRLQQFLLNCADPLPAYVNKQRLATAFQPDLQRVADFMPDVVAHMDLSDDQIQALVYIRRVFCLEISKVYKDRNVILQDLKKSNKQLEKPNQVDEESVFEDLQQTAIIQVQLRFSYVRERRTVHRFMIDCAEVLTLWQEAIMLMVGYQFFGVVIETEDVPPYLNRQRRLKEEASITHSGWKS